MSVAIGIFFVLCLDNIGMYFELKRFFFVINMFEKCQLRSVKQCYNDCDIYIFFTTECSARLIFRVNYLYFRSSKNFVNHFTDRRIFVQILGYFSSTKYSNLSYVNQFTSIVKFIAFLMDNNLIFGENLFYCLL